MSFTNIEVGPHAGTMVTVTSVARVVQSFVPGNGPGTGPTLFSGTSGLHSILIRAKTFVATTASKLTVEIYQGTPSAGDTVATHAPLIATKDFTLASLGFLPEIFQDTLLDMQSEAVSITNGTTYFFSIYTDGNSSPQLGIRGSVNAYAQGERFYATPLNSTFASGPDLRFRINATTTSGGAADPVIKCFDGSRYHLPKDDDIYCLLDNRDPTDRLVINAKCHFRKNGNTYFRYIYVFYHGEEMTVRLPFLQLMKRTADFHDRVDAQTLEPSDKQHFKGKGIKETKLSKRIRCYEITTKNYGKLVLYYSKNKFGFNIKGDMEQFNTPNCAGCLKGEGYMVKVPQLDYVGPL